MTDAERRAGKAEELRQAFDRSFAEARGEGAATLEDLLAIRAGGQRYAVRLAEIAGIHAARTITPVPGPVRELLGIAAFRGAMVAVYDLPALLGHEGGGAPRWMVLSRGAAAVALAIGELEGHLRLPREALASAAGAAGPHRHVKEIARIEEGARPIVSLPSVLEAIRERARPFVPQKER